MRVDCHARYVTEQSTHLHLAHLQHNMLLISITVLHGLTGWNTRPQESGPLPDVSDNDRGPACSPSFVQLVARSTLLACG